MGYADRRFEEGVAVGEQRAEQRARSKLVLPLFRQRFKTLTPAHEAVLLSASQAELEDILSRIFTMNHPDELLTLKTQHES